MFLQSFDAGVEEYSAGCVLMAREICVVFYGLVHGWSSAPKTAGTNGHVVEAIARCEQEWDAKVFFLYAKRTKLDY